MGLSKFNKEGTGKATWSGSNSGNSKGRNFRGMPVLGEEEELGAYVYKFGTKDQANMYIRTTEAIAGYVGRKFGSDMLNLVKYSNEKEFTKPKAPTFKKDDMHSIIMEEYKAELNNYHKKSDQYNEYKGKVFSIILGQCTQVVKNQLENGATFADLEQTCDVVGLLKELKDMAFSTAGVQQQYITLVDSFRRMAAVNQGPSETVANYYQRFITQVEVFIEQWGDNFYPSKLAKANSDKDKEACKDKFLAAMFLTQADKKRFGSSVEGLNNDYLAGKDNYPGSLEATLTFLSHYQGHSVGLGNQVDGNSGTRVTETSFAQTGKMSKVRCYLCNGLGHFKKDCPENPKNQSLMQAGDGDDDENNSVRSGGRRGTPWNG